MNLTEVQGDIFLAPYDSRFVQCISADYVMGKGIATQFNERFNTKQRILERYEPEEIFRSGYCVFDGLITYCLVTKGKYYQKPTYKSLEEALIYLRDNWLSQLTDNEIVISSPKIGCGLDQLNWNKVKDLIINTFAYMDNLIWYVYYL